MSLSGDIWGGRRVPQNDWEVGVPLTFKLNGADFFTQPGGPFTTVYPTLPQGAPFPEYPGAGTLVFSYGPWIGIGCGHFIHEFNIRQAVDYTLDPPQLVALLTCPVCSFVQRAVPGTDEYGPTAVYNPLSYAVVVASLLLAVGIDILNKLV
jgi:hypothetical protein